MDELEIILIFLFIVFITILIVTYKQLISLNKEISYLPKEIKRDLQNSHPLIGESIHDVGPGNWDIVKKDVIIQFASPSCASCHSAVEELIEANKLYNTDIYVVVMPSEDNKESSNFIEKYKDLVTILPYSREVTEIMNITQFPTFIIVNKEGIISLVTVLIKKLDYFMIQMLKTHGDTNEV